MRVRESWHWFSLLGEDRCLWHHLDSFSWLKTANVCCHFAMVQFYSNLYEVPLAYFAHFNSAYAQWLLLSSLGFFCSVSHYGRKFIHYCLLNADTHSFRVTISGARLSHFKFSLCQSDLTQQGISSRTAHISIPWLIKETVAMKCCLGPFTNLLWQIGWQKHLTAKVFSYKRRQIPWVWQYSSIQMV